jgi:mRNA-degrading endonuclease toxin of MazEF toxin-antitoxin module
VATGLTAGEPLRWAVVRVALDPTAGHEQGGLWRALVVSYEPFHRSGLATVCPITAARVHPRYPGEVAIPSGAAGQGRPGVILCQQLRTIALERVVGPPEGRLADPVLRRAVRSALAHHLGLDIPAIGDGASARPPDPAV